MRRPFIRLIKDMSTVHNTRTPLITFPRQIIKEPLARKDIQISCKLINHAELEWAKEFDHDANLFALSITAFMHSPV